MVIMLYPISFALRLWYLLRWRTTWELTSILPPLGTKRRGYRVVRYGAVFRPYGVPLTVWVRSSAGDEEMGVCAFEELDELWEMGV